MRKLMNKKTAAVVAPLAVLGIAGVAYAASLTVTSDTLAAGSDTVQSDCDLKATYSPTDLTWTAAGYQVSAVDVAAASADCTDETFKVTLVGADSKPLASATGKLGGSGVAVNVDLTPVTQGAAVLAADVENVFAVVTGSAYTPPATTTP